MLRAKFRIFVSRRTTAQSASAVGESDLARKLVPSWDSGTNTLERGTLSCLESDQCVLIFPSR